MARFVELDADVSQSDFDDDHDLPTVAAAHKKKDKLSAISFLLTYAKCNEDPDAIFESIDKRREVEKAVGCIELHKDGTPHVHIALHFKKKLTTTNFRWFDYQYDSSCDISHPNVSPAGTWAKCVNYCRGKDKDLVQLFQWKCTFQEAIAAPGAKRKYDLFQVAESYQRNLKGWTQWCYENDVNAMLAKDVWRIHLAPLDPGRIVAPRILGERPASVSDLLVGRELPLNFDRAVVVCGKSGSGKTTWAWNKMFERFGDGIIVGHVDSLKIADRSTKFLLFDELRCVGDPATGKGKWPLEAQIALVDTEVGRVIQCRHNNAWIPANMPKIFTCTGTLPFTRDEQIRRRIHIINLYDVDEEYLWQ